MRKKPNSMDREMYDGIRRQALADARRREAEARAAGDTDGPRIPDSPRAGTIRGESRPSLPEADTSG